MSKQEGYIKKGWGYELIWASTDNYCGKILVFLKEGNKTSMHFHKKKHKTWFINSGNFTLKWIDTEQGVVYEKILEEGNTFVMNPLTPHQLIALSDNASITEASTTNEFDDTFRIVPGDSQIGS